MKRRRISPEDLERVRELARQRRIEAGLPAEDPGDAGYERAVLERKALKKKRNT